ncbi:hypothetical protein [Streptomyces pinistramenti]|uniref:hypothetical protein n=1 Tax=Streptomyces pinistramenti TaxID=2884812 RepID=UPI001D075B9A|nr:hypothetical protein [Streptomyces pinistramenti]MCB5909020.1 hypothetical protein [Streptomyces pinistramenti]
MTDETANSRGAQEAGGAGAASVPVTDASDASAPRQEQAGRTGTADARTSSASAGTVKGSADGLTLRPEERPETKAPTGPDPDAPAATGTGSGATVLRPGSPLPGTAEDAEPEAEAEAEDPATVRDAGDDAAQASAVTAAPAMSGDATAAASDASPKQSGKQAAGARRGLGLFRRTDAAAGAAAGTDAKADGSRVSPGVVAGAALAGVVLLASPFAISALSNAFASAHTGAAGNAAQPLPDNGGDGGRGFVPVPGAAQNDAGKAPHQAGDQGSGNGPGDGGGGTDGTGGGAGPHTDGNAGAHAAPAGGDDHGKKADAPADKGTHAETRSQATATHTFTAYAGPTCPSTGSGSYHEIGAYGDGKDGWLTRTGGSSAGGCQGGVRALPMSGDADRPDSDVTSYWQFNSGMKSASCRISVYIPQGKSPLEVGGSPARYSVHKGTKAYGGDLAGFHIDQPHNKGSWVLGTTVTVEGGRFTLRLTNAGQDWDDDGPTQAHVAASQVKAECRAE